MFSLDSNLLPEPFSLINSIILSFGILFFGTSIIKKYFSLVFLKTDQYIFGFLIGYNVIISVLYFISIFFGNLSFFF